MKKIRDYLQQHKALALSIAIFWTLGIFYGCSLPSKNIPPINIFDHFDKLVHLVFFFGFAFFWYATQKLNLLQAVLFSIAYGIFIEIYQSFIGRSFDLWDIIADAIGACMLWVMFKNIKVN